MGLSYNIIPTSELKDKNAYLEHFQEIETYEFPIGFEMDFNSKYPNLQELTKAILESGCQIAHINEQENKDSKISTSYQLKYPNYKFESDFTVHHNKNDVSSIMGIKADFRVMLRIATKLTLDCGALIIWSAYDALYIEKGKTFDEIWDKLKSNRNFEE